MRPLWLPLPHMVAAGQRAADRKKVARFATVALGLFASLAHAQDSARWIVRAGVHPVQPKEDPHSQLRVGDGASGFLAATRMLTDRVGFEGCATLPVRHDLFERSNRKAGSFRQAPLTLSIQYHVLDPNGLIRAYVGAGMNYTRFSGERTTGTLAGATFDLESSYGAAAQVGLDLDLGRAWFVSIDGRWFDIDSRVALNGAAFGTVDLDPYAFGVSVGRRLP